MSEEVKNIRLNKVAKEFNVGVSRIVEFLAKKGHHIENNPNTKISGEVYELLSKAFHSERTVKENADKIEIVAPVNKSVVIEASHTCMTLRGVQKANAVTTTSAFSGIFLRDERTRNEFLNLIR